jgi:hypothetical protein
MLLLKDLISTQSLAIGVGLLLLYIVCGAIFRLNFSPIAKFPGPKLAALTLWYEFYYDGVKRGKYVWEIAKMHEKYGLFNHPSWPASDTESLDNDSQDQLSG